MKRKMEKERGEQRRQRPRNGETQWAHNSRVGTNIEGHRRTTDKGQHQQPPRIDRDHRFSAPDAAAPCV